jgi:hypothetical protein
MKREETNGAQILVGPTEDFLSIIDNIRIRPRLSEYHQQHQADRRAAIAVRRRLALAVVVIVHGP